MDASAGDGLVGLGHGSAQRTATPAWRQVWTSLWRSAYGERKAQTRGLVAWSMAGRSLKKGRSVPGFDALDSTNL